jgi:hypothetical protein
VNFLLDESILTNTSFPLKKTFDPAPPNIEMVCTNQSTQDVNINWMLVGRTG